MRETTHYADVEIRILARLGAAYPVEMTLNSEQEYGPGSLSTAELPWLPSADPAADGERLFAGGAPIYDLAAAAATPFSRYLAGKWQPGAPVFRRSLRVLVAIAVAAAG